MKIDLGYGIYFEDGEIISTQSQEQETEIWMSWDEGWKWVISALEIIEKEYEKNKKTAAL